MAANTIPPAIKVAGGILRTSRGVSWDPTTKPTAHGSVHNPASRGREPEHQLQVLREEEEAAEHDHDAQPVRCERRTETRLPEQPEVDERIVEVPLPSHERDPEQEAGDDGYDGIPPHSVLRELLQAEDHREDGDERHRRAQQIQASWLRIPVLWEQPRAEHEDQAHHRHGEQEHRSPPEELKHQPPEQGADRPAHREAGDPYGDRGLALLWVEEHVADQGQCRGREGRPGQPEQRAGRDQHLGATRERGQHGRHPERDGTDHQQPPADPIAQRSHRDQGPRDHEPVDVDDPEQLRAGGPQVLADLRYRQVQDGEVHHVEHARESDYHRGRSIRAGSPWTCRARRSCFLNVLRRYPLPCWPTLAATARCNESMNPGVPSM
jgi:hypothetical protein